MDEIETTTNPIETEPAPEPVASSEKSTTNSYLKGFCGALIGGVIGGVVAVVLTMIGIISGLAAIVSVVAGAFLYQKLGGKPNKMMLLIVGVTTLACMALSVYVSYVIVVGMSISDLGVNVGAFEAFGYFMDVEEFAQGFYTDLIVALVFAVIGVVVEVVVIAMNMRKARRAAK